MKRMILAFALFFSFCNVSFAGMAEDNYLTKSSYTEAETPGPVMFSTGPTRFEAIVISSPAPNSHFVIFRSTIPWMISNLATQTLVSTSYSNFNQAPVAIPLFGITNSSYTFISKVGTAKVTLFFRLVGGNNNVTPPGLNVFGEQK